MSPTRYTTEQKMRGEDLHGLACRVPEPTAGQARCTHTKWVRVDQSWVDDDGIRHEEEVSVEESTCVDVPGTNNFRCTRCGYTRRY